VTWKSPWAAPPARVREVFVLQVSEDDAPPPGFEPRYHREDFLRIRGSTYGHTYETTMDLSQACFFDSKVAQMWSEYLTQHYKLPHRIVRLEAP
jgi:hypothetical protein